MLAASITSTHRFFPSATRVSAPVDWRSHVVRARNALDIVNALSACDHVRLLWLDDD
jgi:hypothetical protein